MLHQKRNLKHYYCRWFKQSEGWWNGHRKDLPWLQIFKEIVGQHPYFEGSLCKNCMVRDILVSAGIHPNLNLWYFYTGVINQIFHVIQECYLLYNPTVTATFVLQLRCQPLRRQAWPNSHI